MNRACPGGIDWVWPGILSIYAKKKREGVRIISWRGISVLLLLLAGCGTPVVQDRMCTGLVAGSPGVVISSQSAPAPEATPVEMLRADVAARTARMIAARVAPRPVAEAAVVVGPAIAGAGPVTPSFARARTARVAPQVVEIDLLAMTTGGQYGSFSSGFLSGWGQRTAGPRPEFAVVTGASAGGIIAPLVFAGRAFDDRLTLNTGIGEADVVRRRAVIELLGASSLFSTAPLERAVRNAADDALIAAIAARWAEGNDLFLGATNLDRGRFDLFDIGGFMADGTIPLAEKRECLVSAVMATSAIPALFPPRRINGDLYTDAGVRQSVFLRGVRDGILESQRLLGVRVRVNAYVLVNGDLTVSVRRTESGLLGIAGRTFQLVSDEGLRQSLIETADLARETGWTLRAVRAPEFDTLGCGKDSALFSACVTGALFRAGEAMALAPEIGWLTGAELKRIAGEY